jgi:predicted GNAT superfamily acetyltransferase
MDDIVIRECITIEELDDCVRLQRDVFGLPELEISPRRHLIVSRQAGGWTLGAFTRGGRLVGFVHHLVAIDQAQKIFGYSHMMAVSSDYQNRGVGARLKWSQRERALSLGQEVIRWTWDPLQARNAHFNLNRLGVTVRQYVANFYGTDYPMDPRQKAGDSVGIDSDRLFATWELRARRVIALAGNRAAPQLPTAEREVQIPADWVALSRQDRTLARAEQLRVRAAFQDVLAAGLICAAFERDADSPRYLFYREETLNPL